MREAQTLGLDCGDSDIRSRLAQKTNFLTLSVAQSTEPDDAALKVILNKNSERFLSPVAIAFQQI